MYVCMNENVGPCKKKAKRKLKGIRGPDVHMGDKDQVAVCRRMILRACPRLVDLFFFLPFVCFRFFHWRTHVYVCMICRTEQGIFINRTSYVATLHNRNLVVDSFLNKRSLSRVYH